MTRRRALGWAASVAVVGVLAVVLVRSGARLADHLDELGAGSLLVAGGCVLGALVAGMLSWRAVLADLGSPLPFGVAARVFFLSQVGKYLPGSLWPLLAQMELGREQGVPRARSGAVGVVTLVLSLFSGLVLAAGCLPFTSAGALGRYWWAFLAVPVLGVALVPRVTNGALALLLRLARRAPLEHALSERGIVTALAWSVVAWLLLGAHVAVLAHDLGARGAGVLPVATGAFALAWTAGFLVVLAPAGAGVREAALVLALGPVLARDPALLLALVSRALMSVGDVLAAAVAVATRHRAGAPADADA